MLQLMRHFLLVNLQYVIINNMKEKFAAGSLANLLKRHQSINHANEEII